MMDVSCAIIIHAGKMLAVQRGPLSNHPWQWEFPGGKVNETETAEQCIVREINEELCVSIEIIERLQAIEFDYGMKPLCLIPFVCHITSGAIKLTEHVGMRWINLKEWESLQWASADYQLIIKNKIQLGTFLI